MSESSRPAARPRPEDSGDPREAAAAAFRLGIEHAAQLLEIAADTKTDELLAGAPPSRCFTVAAALIRDQGTRAADAIDAKPRPGSPADRHHNRAALHAVGPTGAV